MASSIATSRAIGPASSCWPQEAAFKAPRSSFFSGKSVGVCGSTSDLCRKTSSARRAVAVADLVVDGVKEDEKPAAAQATVAEAKSFVAEVASLAKLVDSKDIVELELKHKDYEITIRKAEALKPAAVTSPPPSPQIFPAFPPYPAFAPPAAPVPAQPSAPAPAPASTSEASPPAPIAPAHPPMLSPMAGTFYRCPGPGEPAFVKVGDRVRKGQVICIIEAMKLMNTIESDQDGTIQDILVEDGKPVSVDMPLFVIKP